MNFRINFAINQIPHTSLSSSSIEISIEELLFSFNFSNLVFSAFVSVLFSVAISIQDSNDFSLKLTFSELESSSSDNQSLSSVDFLLASSISFVSIWVAFLISSILFSIFSGILADILLLF
jgi:hypothetical protein